MSIEKPMCVFIWYHFRTASGIHTYLDKTSSSCGDQRPALIWRNSIFVLGEGLKYELSLGLAIETTGK